jgi:hypothetical protein
MKKRVYQHGLAGDKSVVEKEGSKVYVTDEESERYISFSSWKAADAFLVKLGYT